MERFGVRIAGQVPDTGHVARLAAPIIGVPLGEVSEELARSGQLATALSREQADRLANQLGDLGLEVFVDPVAVDPSTASNSTRCITDPLHGLAPLRALADASSSVEMPAAGKGLASALVFDEDDISRPAIGTEPPGFMRPLEPEADDDEDQPAPAPAPAMFGMPALPEDVPAPKAALLAPPAGAFAPPPSASGASASSNSAFASSPSFESSSDAPALVKPPRVSPSQEVPLIRDPFDSGPSAPGLPPPIFGAPPLAILSGDDSVASGGRTVSEPDPPRRSSMGILIVILLVIAVGVLGYMLLRRGDNPDQLLAMARDATASGQYDEALSLVARAREAGGIEAALRPVVRDAQAGPLLDASESHMAAGAWVKASATLDAARALAPSSARVVALTLKLERLSASSAKAVDSPTAANTGAKQPATDAPAAPKQPASAPPVEPPPASAASERSTPPETSPVAEASAAEVERPRKSRRIARLLVRSPVPASIFIDGRSTRRLTPATLKLTPGDHELELRDAQSGKVLAARSVRAVAGRAARINFDVPTAKQPARPPEKRVIPTIADPVKPATDAPRRVEMIGAPSSGGTQNGGNGRVDIIGQ